MKQTKALMILLIIVLICRNLTYCKKYKCEILWSGLEKQCGVVVTREDNEIEFYSDDPLTSFEAVEIKGKISSLSKDICIQLPNLKYVWLWYMDIDEYEPDMFTTCKKIIEINIFDSKPKKKPFDKNLFSPLTRLKHFTAGWMKGINLDFDLSSLAKLERFIYFNNGLVTYNPQVLKNQHILTHLGLYNNELLEFDIDMVLKYAPKLKKLEIADNHILCSRLKAILNITKARHIDATSYTRWGHENKRNYTPEKIEGIHCLNKPQLIEEMIEREIL